MTIILRLKTCPICKVWGQIKLKWNEKEINIKCDHCFSSWRYEIVESENKRK